MCRLQILLLRCADVQTCRAAAACAELQNCRCADVQMCRAATACADVARADHEGCGANHQERLKPLISALIGSRTKCWTTSNCSATLSSRHQTAQQHYRLWPVVAGPWPRNCSLIADQWECPHKSKIGNSSSLQSDLFGPSSESKIRKCFKMISILSEK